MSPAERVRRTRNVLSIGARERLLLQVLYVVALMAIMVATTILRIKNDMDDTTVGVIFGAIIGHVGTLASQRGASRHTDSGG